MNQLIVTSRQKCDTYNSGYHTMLIAEQIERDSFHDFRYLDEDIWILWKKVSPDNFGGFKEYTNREVWNAKMSYTWMIKDFIPYVIWCYEITSLEKLFKYRSFKKFKSQIEINGYVW